MFSRSLVIVVMLAGLLLASPGGAVAQSTGHRSVSQVRSLRRSVVWNRSRTWHWQDLAGVARTTTTYPERRTHSVAFLRWLDRSWSRRRLAARRLVGSAGPVAHWALWNCIHRGEGDGWNPTHTYSGPLQMTSGWEGYPVSDWNTVPLTVVYADAETQFRAHGYSTSWLEGQWPHTSPPCLGFA